MKKTLFTTILFLLLTTVSFATTALYRISSNEVVMIDVADGDFAAHLNKYLAVKTGATYPDGTECRDEAYNVRVFGIAKILDGDIVRNATQNEIDTFRPAHVDDLLQNQADMAISYFKNDMLFRRVMTAFASIIVDEMNTLRSEHGLPDRTLEQLKTAIENRISKDD